MILGWKTLILSLNPIACGEANNSSALIKIPIYGIIIIIIIIINIIIIYYKLRFLFVMLKLRKHLYLQLELSKTYGRIFNYVWR
jgi:membrane-anchored glycerophosphoryl diester phosphodiesterase (GDPDase)